jgi:hypothetical protein
MYDASKPDGAADNLSLLFDGSVFGVIGASQELPAPCSDRLSS